MMMIYDKRGIAMLIHYAEIDDDFVTYSDDRIRQPPIVPMRALWL